MYNGCNNVYLIKASTLISVRIVSNTIIMKVGKDLAYKGRMCDTKKEARCYV